jgi:hypothetical protein
MPKTERKWFVPERQGKTQMFIQSTKAITIKLPDHLSAEDAEALRAYLVDGAGKLIQSARFSNHAARIGSGQSVRSSRLFIGPSLPADYPEDKIDVYTLSAIGAYQLSPSNRDEITVRNLPPNILQPLPVHFLNIQGNVSNTLTIAGAPQTGPVSQARVHICSVQWIYELPVWLRPVVSAEIVTKLQEVVSSANAAPRKPAAAALKRLPAAAEAQLMSATPDNIHGIVAQNTEYFLPIFCRFPILLPLFLRLTQQEVVYTDCNGYFDAWRVVFGNAPENIYVWIEASINGNWVTVYNPPAPCNSYWNYVSGTPIDIGLANPAIPPCNCGNNVIDGTVWFTAIGSAAIASTIEQDANATAYGVSTFGCTNITDPNGLSPFGGTLNLWLASGQTVPAPYYRWSYTLLDASGNPTGQPVIISGAVARPYLYPTADGDWEPGSVSLLATDTHGNVGYSFPDYDVTSYPGVPAEAEWNSFNFISASLVSTKIPNGALVRLQLELLNLEGGLFTPVNVPPATFQVSNNTNAYNSYGGSSAAPADNLTLEGGQASSFSLIIRVDNTQAYAAINDAWLLDGSNNPIKGGNSGPCGFMQFTDASLDVSVSFDVTASSNYGSFAYSAVKGDSGPVIAVSGYVFANPVAYTLAGGAEQFALAAGIYTSTPAISALLGNCPQAAFGESLNVISLATDGSSLLANSVGYPYADSAAGAFALTPASA